METDPRSTPVFTPDNEPYLGLTSLLHFDHLIVACLEANRLVAAFTHQNRERLTDLQRAACQVIPQGLSLALSIRELLRQAYLFSALVLIRPLIERAAVISYLHVKPAAVELWNAGWTHRERPSLAEMMDVMSGGRGRDAAQEICSIHNHVVHGDPIGAYHNLVHLPDGRIGYACGKVLDHPQLCDAIAAEAQCYLIVLFGRMRAIFPGLALDTIPDQPVANHQGG